MYMQTFLKAAKLRLLTLSPLNSAIPRQNKNPSRISTERTIISE